MSVGEILEMNKGIDRILAGPTIYFFKDESCTTFWGQQTGWTGEKWPGCHGQEPVTLPVDRFHLVVRSGDAPSSGPVAVPADAHEQRDVNVLEQALAEGWTIQSLRGPAKPPIGAQPPVRPHR